VPETAAPDGPDGPDGASSTSSARLRPKVRKTYIRVAILVAVLVAARLAISDDQRPGPDQLGAASPAAGSDEKVEIPVPQTFTATGFDAATQDDGPSVFEDVTKDLAVPLPHRADRLDVIELPKAQISSLMGVADPSPSQIEDWVGKNLSPFITEMVSLKYYGTGQAWGDYDGDGDPDLYVTNQRGPNVLLENRDGTLVRSALGDQVELADQVSGGAVFVDYDNDGWVDLHVLGRGADVLLHNEEGRGFRDVTDAAGIDDPGMGETATWADYDGDGLLDAYVTDYGCQPCNDSPPAPLAERDQDHLFHNDGDGTFTDETALIEKFEGTRGLGLSASWIDYDQDGRMDLYVANDARGDKTDEEVAAGIDGGDGSTPGNVMLHNEGPGCGGWCFRDATKETKTGLRADAMGLATGDLNGDGTIDLFTTNAGYDAGPTHLLANDGDGSFSDVSDQVGANLGEWSWGTNTLDLDNDGRLDLYVATGHSELTMQAALEDLADPPIKSDPTRTRAGLRDGKVRANGRVDAPPWPVAKSKHPRTDNDRVLHQQADGTFDELVLGPTDRFSGLTFGSAVADYDGDGFPDVVVGNLDDGYHLLRNRAAVGADNHRAVLRLKGDGHRVNTQAVGSRIVIKTTGGRELVRTVQLGSSLGSGDDLAVIAGLGGDGIDSVTITWPDGSVQRSTDVQVDHSSTLTYGSDDVISEPLR
jgi:hypothetical protein